MELSSSAAPALLQGERAVAVYPLLKNKTTKTFFVVELKCHHRPYGPLRAGQSYFFFVVFFAFFAGAFFVAMYLHPLSSWDKG